MFTIQATANDGTTLTDSGAGKCRSTVLWVLYHWPCHAQFYYDQCGPSAAGFAIGEFGISCQPIQAVTNLPSDQKAGSFLVFPYYTSKVADGRDTRISITNVSNAAPTLANSAYVHLFFIDGNTCYQMDTFVCLTPNASINFNASYYDPETHGLYICRSG